MIATSGFRTALECTKFVFDRGFTTDPAMGAYIAPQTPLAGLGVLGLLLRGGERSERNRDGREKTGRDRLPYANFWIRFCRHCLRVLLIVLDYWKWNRSFVNKIINDDADEVVRLSCFVQVFAVKQTWLITAHQLIIMCPAHLRRAFTVSALILIINHRHLVASASQVFIYIFIYSFEMHNKHRPLY